MPTNLVAEQTITVGDPVVIEAPSPTGSVAVVFEADGETGYFYAVDLSLGDMQIMDGLLIYTVDEVSDRDIPSTIQIMWDEEGTHAALTINQYPHAVFDFGQRRGYSRTEFPEPPAESDWTHYGWNDELRSLFF